MLDVLICPLTKSPHSRGRIGQAKMQDWYRGLVQAATLRAMVPHTKILVLSAFCAQDSASELELYRDALRELGVPDSDLVCIHEAYETTEQIERAMRYAIENGMRLVFIATWTHYLRVLWLVRGSTVSCRIAWGIPRPREAFTDAVLSIAFPIIGMLGMRNWFLQKTRERRKRGVL